MDEKEIGRRKGHDTLFLFIFLFTVLLAIILTIVNFAFIFLGILTNVFVLYLWWDESSRFPYILRCPNCDELTKGTLMTYFLHLHKFEKVYKRCPVCRRYGWLEAINV